MIKKHVKRIFHEFAVMSQDMGDTDISVYEGDYHPLKDMPVTKEDMKEHIVIVSDIFGCLCLWRSALMWLMFRNIITFDFKMARHNFKRMRGSIGTPNI